MGYKQKGASFKVTVSMRTFDTDEGDIIEVFSILRTSPVHTVLSVRVSAIRSYWNNCKTLDCFISVLEGNWCPPGWAEWVAYSRCIHSGHSRNCSEGLSGCEEIVNW